MILYLILLIYATNYSGYQAETYGGYGNETRPHMKAKSRTLSMRLIAVSYIFYMPGASIGTLPRRTRTGTEESLRLFQQKLGHLGPAVLAGQVEKADYQDILSLLAGAEVPSED